MTHISHRMRQFRAELIAGGFVHQGGPGQLARDVGGGRWLFVRTDMEHGRYVVTVYCRSNGMTGSRTGTHCALVGRDTDLDSLRYDLVAWTPEALWPPSEILRPLLREVFS